MNLKTYSKKVVLKNGVEVVLRPMAAADEEQLYQFFKNLPEEDRLFLKDDVTQKETIHQWIMKLDYSRILPIIAEKDEHIIGDGTLHMNVHGWSKHVGEIRIVVAHEFQKHGLGSIIAKELVHHAVNKGLDKLIAEIMDRQKGAFHAFSKLGFVQEAVLNNHVTDIHGYKRDLIILSNHVDSLWHKMEVMVSDFNPCAG